MNSFLQELADRKYRYYRYLYIVKPQAYTQEDCYERIKKQSKYQEVIDVIDYLPLDQKIFVDDRFNEMKEDFK